jgi:hypothetical protein
MESSVDSPMGTVAINLTGTAPSGSVYRLRDATINVDGPDPTVFHTEDDPTRTSLSADVTPGDYAATVQPGWRIERVDSGTAAPVNATLTSDNPVAFTVLPQMRTAVPISFKIDAEDVDLGAGFDIVIGVDEQIPSPGGGYQAIDAASARNRLVFDTARQTLYALNTADQEIERFGLSSGQWSALDPVVIPGLTDIAITPDGTTMIVLDTTHVNDVALGSGSFTPTQRATLTDTFCGNSLARAAAGSSNKVVIATALQQCSGFSSAYLYDTQSHALTSSLFLYNGTVGASGDGTRIYAGSNGIFPPDDITIYNPQTNTSTGSSVSVNLSSISASGDGSRVILENAGVYSKSLTLLGNLPPGGTAIASRNSSRAYVYRDDAPGPRVALYDLNGALQAGAVFPLLRTFRLPHTPNSSNGFSAVTMTTNADDTQLFISGDLRILVVPVN